MGLENTGKTIAQLRKKAGLTQRGLAEYLGISDKAVSKWERGLSLPDISCLEKLAAGTCWSGSCFQIYLLI